MVGSRCLIALSAISLRRATTAPSEAPIMPCEPSGAAAAIPAFTVSRSISTIESSTPNGTRIPLDVTRPGRTAPVGGIFSTEQQRNFDNCDVVCLSISMRLPNHIDLTVDEIGDEILYLLGVAGGKTSFQNDVVAVDIPQLAYLLHTTPRVFFRQEQPVGLLRATRVDQPYSGLMLAARTTLPHFSASSVMSLPKSAGEPASAASPKSASRAFILGSARAAFISLFSLSIILGGVLFGAATPNQLLASKPGRNSLTVGISGRTSERVAVVTANARSLPVLMCSIDDGVSANITCTCPASRSVNAGALPR